MVFSDVFEAEVTHIGVPESGFDQYCADQSVSDGVEGVEEASDFFTREGFTFDFWRCLVSRYINLFEFEWFEFELDVRLEFGEFVQVGDDCEFRADGGFSVTASNA